MSFCSYCALPKVLSKLSLEVLKMRRCCCSPTTIVKRSKLSLTNVKLANEKSES